MKSITIKAYAKINLFLAVTGRETNGYHAVETVMQAVDLYDPVMVAIDEDEPLLGHISLTCSDPALACDEKNLAWRAAAAFETLHPVTGCIRLHIEKRIPIAGGLAGGSTDAAAVLVGLNTLCGEPLDRQTLLTLAATLGADVPFCVLADSGSYAALGLHYGEQMEVLPPLQAEDTLLLVSVGEPVSTPWAYGEIDRQNPDFPGCSADIAAALRSASPAETVLPMLYNGFEEAVLPSRPRAAAALAFMKTHGARAAMMSGSGPTVVGMFPAVNGTPSDDAARAAAILELEGARVYTCRLLH